MSATVGAWLEELTWPEVRAHVDNDTPVIVPVGALAKEHGRHLPLNTDYLLARELSQRLILGLPVLAAPIVGFGYYPAFAEYPGSQHVSAATFSRLLEELLEKLVIDGFTRLVVLNTGVSTVSPIDIVVRDLYARTGRRCHVARIEALGRRADGMLEQRAGGHADKAETSMMLVIRPDLVRMARAKVDYGNTLTIPRTVFTQPAIFRNDPSSPWDHSVDGVRGDPGLATEAKGEALLTSMVEDLVAALCRVFPGLDTQPAAEIGHA